MTSRKASNGEDPGRLAPLDGLRGVAILSVLVYHYSVRWTPPASNTDLYPYHGFFNQWSWLNYTWSGVELFFVISGFVICMTLERCASTWDFARRRLARLWPAMLVCASLTMAVSTLGPNQWRVGPLSFLLSILFIDPAFVGGLLHIKGLGWVDGVYWTLWIEVRFYLISAVLFMLFRQRFLTALTVVMMVSFVAGLRHMTYPGRAWAWIILLPTFLPYFVLGAGAMRLSHERRLRIETAVSLFLSAAVIVAQGWLSFEYPSGGPQGFVWINASIIAAILAFSIGSPVVRPFGWRPLVRIGQASYSLYLIHSVVGIVLINLLSRVLPWPAALALVIAGVVAFSLFLHRWIETPGKTLVLRLTSPLMTAAARLSGDAAFRHPHCRALARHLPSSIANG